MLDHIWTVLCSRAMVDKFTNMVSLEGVIEQMTVHGQPEPGPAVPTNLDVMSLWARRDLRIPAQARARLSVISPSGKTLGATEYDVLLEETERHRQRITFPAFPLETAGRYVFRVEVQLEAGGEWSECARVPLSVVFEPKVGDQS